MEYYYVYVITFSNDKFYIGKRTSSVEPENDVNYWGSPVTFKYMWEDSSLQKEKHIIKICDTEKDVIELERNLILYSWRMYPELCLNRNASRAIHPTMGEKGGRSTAERYSKEFTLKSPEGKIIKGKNISKFCRENNLDISNIIRVINGSQKHHKGWALCDTENDRFFKVNGIASEYSKNFIVKSPEGKIIEAKNISQFSKNNNLIASMVSKLINGKILSYKGWTIPTNDECGKNVREINEKMISEKYIKSFTLKSPDGVIVECDNITKFCEEYGLQHSNLVNVIRGKRVSHKGWTLPHINEKEIDKIKVERYKKISEKISKKFKLNSPDGIIIEGHNIKKFCAQNGLHINSVRRLMNGKKKEYKGWTIFTEN